MTAIGVVALGCARTAPPATSNAHEPEPLRVEKGAPPPGARPLRELRAVDGKGCGLFGKLGSYDGAVAQLREQARAAGADYVQLTSVTEPFADHECVHKEYVLKGVAYRVRPAPTAAPSPSPAPAPSSLSQSEPVGAKRPERSLPLGSASYSFRGTEGGSRRSLSLWIRVPSGIRFGLWVDAAVASVSPDGLELVYDPAAHRVALLQTPGGEAVAVGPVPFYLDEAWHVWRVVRSADRVEVLIDGQLLLLHASPAPPGDRSFTLQGEKIEIGIASDALPAPRELVATSVDLPGAKAPVSLDLIAYDKDHGRVWVPVGDTGSADVFELATRVFKRVDGFKTAQREMHGQLRTLGPSSVTVGDGVVYVANRATSEVCAIDEKSLKRGQCLKLPTPADFVTYVASTKEVWATTPKDQSITLLDASKPAVLRPKLVIKAAGSVEGAAVDTEHGLFYTNLEDKNQTLVVSIASHAIQATFSPGCSDAPHGVAVDPARGFVLVACSDGVRVLDGAHGGAPLGTLETGDGVDDLYYQPAKQLVYVAASKARRLTIARIGDTGQATVVATGSTAERARNAVADSDGNVYVTDAASARLLIFPAIP